MNYFVQWVDEQCVPLVREITFNNAEEITEEGLPLMILFHKREATKDVDQFTQAAQRWLFSQKGKINIVTAQAEQVSFVIFEKFEFLLSFSSRTPSTTWASS